jgi:glycosyltransferase involved in cell wall biosynthesis
VIEAVTRLLDQPELRASLGARAVEAARRNSWATVVDRQVELYELAIARNA